MLETQVKVLGGVTTPSEAAQWYNVTARTIRNWCDAGWVVYRRSGGIYLISVESLNAHVKGEQNGKSSTEG